ncbi:MAG: hypothetical protein ACW97Z_00360 [Candidatus Hodarchaeales archaeon]|jgi:hypothetical protein
MQLSRLIEKFRTEILGFLAAFVLISAGLIFPYFIPDQVNAPPGFQDTTWIKSLISYLLIGMGLVSFFWLVIIHRFMVHKSKKDYMY